LDEPNTDQQMQSHAVLDSYNYTYIACAFWLPAVLDICIYCAFWLLWHILTISKGSIVNIQSRTLILSSYLSQSWGVTVY